VVAGWDGQTLLLTQITASCMLSYHPGTGQNAVFREHTNHTNGLAFDSEGRVVDRFTVDAEGMSTQ
jgi:sugar lactone lactonase YvrE